MPRGTRTWKRTPQPLRRRLQEQQGHHSQRLALGRLRLTEGAGRQMLHRGLYGHVGRRDPRNPRRTSGPPERGTQDRIIYLCVDNQNALRDLAGGPRGGREDERKYVEEIGTLRLKGGKDLGKWTPSHQGIPGNEQADTSTKKRLTESQCTWSRATPAWGRSLPREMMLELWTTKSNKDPSKPFYGTPSMPRIAAAAIARLRCHVTSID